MTRRLRHLPLIVAWGLLLTGCGVLFLAGERWDYRSYYQGALRLAEGQPLYQGFTGTTYVYPPLLAQVLAPFARVLGWDGLAVVWLIGGAALLIGATALLGRYASTPARRRMVWIMPLLFTPVVQGFWVGQVSFLMLAGLVGVWAAVRADRRSLAGALLALLAWIKVYPALLVIYFVWRRDWRLIRAVIVAGLLLGLFQVVVSGPDLMIEYFTDLLPGLSSQGQIEGLFKNCSILGFSQRLFTANASILPLVDAPALAGPTRLVLSLLVAGATVWAVTRRPATVEDPARFDLEYALMVVTTLLLGATLWVSGMAPLLLAYGLLLERATTARWRRLAWLSFGVTSAYFPLLLAFQVGNRLPALLLSIGFYGVLGLWVLLVAVLGRGATRSAAAPRADTG